MSTPFDIFGVVYGSGAKLVAELILPAGKVTAAATTITGGTAGGPNTVPTGATSIYLGMSLTSGMTQIYEGSADIGGTLLPNSVDRPYMVRVWSVDPAATMTTYAGLTAAVTGAAAYWAGQSGHTANDAIAYLRDVPSTLQGGMLKGGVWQSATDVTDAAAAAAVIATLAAKFTGMTLLANWLRALARKSAADATALSEINTGGGTYSPTTDSAEAVREAVDAVPGGGGGGGGGDVDFALQLD